MLPEPQQGFDPNIEMFNLLAIDEPVRQGFSRESYRNYLFSIAPQLDRKINPETFATAIDMYNLKKGLGKSPNEALNLLYDRAMLNPDVRYSLPRIEWNKRMVDTFDISPEAKKRLMKIQDDESWFRIIYD